MNHLVRVQLAASAWGLRVVIDACDGLSEAQFRASHDIGPPPGSLQGTLAHILESMAYFADNFEGREYVEPADFAQRASTLAGARGLLEELAWRLESSAQRFLEMAVDDVLAPVRWPGVERDIPFALALAQVVDHATHHRVQCMHMLKRLGVDPLPEAFPLEWPGVEQGMLARGDAD